MVARSERIWRMVTVMIIIFLLGFAGFLYLTSPNEIDGFSWDTQGDFPPLQITLRNTGTEKLLIIYHISDYPLQWADLRVQIEDNIDDKNRVTFDAMSGSTEPGQPTIFTNLSNKLNSFCFSIFDKIDLIVGRIYIITINNICSQSKPFVRKVVCES